MLAVLASVLISALITIGLLLVTRQRLTRQFEDVQRRLLQTERALVEIRVWRDASTTDAQLVRLHQGLVLVQENVARRYGSLVPLAEEWARRPGRLLTDFQAAALCQWAQALVGAMAPEDVRSWCAAISAKESGGPISLPTADLLALVISADGIVRRGGSVGVAGDLAGDFAELLCEALPASFCAEDFVPVSEGESGAPLPGLIVVGDSAGNLATWVRSVASDGLVVFAATEGEVPGIRPLVTQWGVTAGRKLSESRVEPTPATV